MFVSGKAAGQKEAETRRHMKGRGNRTKGREGNKGSQICQPIRMDEHTISELETKNIAQIPLLFKDISKIHV